MMKIVENVRTRRYDVWMLPSRAYIPLLAVRGILLWMYALALLLFPILLIALVFDFPESTSGAAFFVVLGSALLVIPALIALAMFAWTIRRDKIVHSMRIKEKQAHNELPQVGFLHSLWLLFADDGPKFNLPKLPRRLAWIRYHKFPNMYRFLKQSPSRWQVKLVALTIWIVIFGGEVAFIIWFGWFSGFTLPLILSVIVLALFCVLWLVSLVHMLLVRKIAPAESTSDVRQIAGEEG